TILMLTLNGAKSGLAHAGVMVELDDPAQVHAVLTGIGGWTMLTGINLMLFSLLHNPCGTTILTIWRETRSAKWTAVSTLLPRALPEMLKRLEGRALVAHVPYYGVRLRERGRAIAVTTIRRHRLLECFLADVLAYPLDLVHDEAERLEHHISDEFERRLDEAL